MLAWLVILLALVVVGTFAWGGLRGAPWVPTWNQDLPRIVALAEVRPGEVVADLGCGTGGVLAAFARSGCAVRGWEIAIVPWLISWLRLRRFPDTQIRFSDFWNADLSACTCVYVFLFPTKFARLREKLEHDLQPGSRVIVCTWPVPGWTPIAVDRPSPKLLPIYRYEIGRTVLASERK